MVNWKTTVGGLVAAIGLALTASADPLMHMAGVILSALGAFFMGVSGKDKDVTGAGPTATRVQ